MKRYVCGLVIVSLMIIALASCSPPPTDPASVTKALFTAINQGKADDATNLFAEDGELTAKFAVVYSGQKLRDFFSKTLIPLKTQVDQWQLTVDGINVAGTFRMTSSEIKSGSPNGFQLLQVIGVIQNGKINTMSWTAPK
jgi:hypothetical protein